MKYGRLISMVDSFSWKILDHMDELSKALTEYYDPRTDLLRKQRLHEDLNRFLIDRNSWQSALLAFQQQQHEANLTLPPVVIYFLLQVLEHSIRHRDGDQQQTRQILLWLFIHRFDSIPVYVRSKFAFLIVLIARCDNRWSTDEFFQISYHVRSVRVKQRRAVKRESFLSLSIRWFSSS